MDHTTFRPDFILGQFKFLNRIYKKPDARFQQTGLIANDVVHCHLAECDIKQSGLIPVLIGRRKHGDFDLSVSYLSSKPPRDVIGHDRATHAPTNK